MVSKVKGAVKDLVSGLPMMVAGVFLVFVVVKAAAWALSRAGVGSYGDKIRDAFRA